MNPRLPCLGLTLSVLLAACGSSGQATDGGTAAGGDASALLQDSSAADAGSSDTGALDLDADADAASVPDLASTADAASVPDLASTKADAPSAPDAIAEDTGPGVDAGAEAGASVDGGGAEAATGGVQMKFCNGLAGSGNANLRLSLRLGDPPVVLTADSGACAPPVGHPCVTIPSGPLAVRLVDDQGAEIASGTVTTGPGEQWLLLATLDDVTAQPTVIGGALKPEYTCSSVDPFAGRADGGIGP